MNEYVSDAAGILTIKQLFDFYVDPETGFVDFGPFTLLKDAVDNCVISLRYQRRREETEEFFRRIPLVNSRAFRETPSDHEASDSDHEDHPGEPKRCEQDDAAVPIPALSEIPTPESFRAAKSASGPVAGSDTSDTYCFETDCFCEIHIPAARRASRSSLRYRWCSVHQTTLRLLPERER